VIMDCKALGFIQICIYRNCVGCYCYF